MKTGITPTYNNKYKLHIRPILVYYSVHLYITVYYIKPHRHSQRTTAKKYTKLQTHQYQSKAKPHKKQNKIKTNKMHYIRLHIYMLPHQTQEIKPINRNMKQKQIKNMTKSSYYSTPILLYFDD
jgi:hypothetical protein